MVTSMNEFFEHLEPKRCTVCGEILVEQADCYVCTCEKCDPFQAHSVFTVNQPQLIAKS